MKAVHVGMTTYRYGYGLVFSAPSQEAAEKEVESYIRQLAFGLERKVRRIETHNIENDRDSDTGVK